MNDPSALLRSLLERQMRLEHQLHAVATELKQAVQVLQRQQALNHLVLYALPSQPLDENCIPPIPPSHGAGCGCRRPG